MKVALIVPAIGNDAHVTTPVVNAFVRFLGREVNLHVFPVHSPAGWRQISVEGAVLHPVDGSRSRLRHRVPRMLRTIRAEHRERRFDLIHGMWLFEPGALAVAAARLLGIPSVVSIGGAEVVHLRDIDYGGLRTWRGRGVHRQVLQRATVVTGGSQYILARAGTVTDRRGGYALAPLPVDTELFTPGERTLLTDAGAPHIVQAASLIPVKDQDTLLRAFALILDVLPGARLTIAGEDPFGHRFELEDLTESLGIGGAVRFAGPVPHLDMPSFYHQADLFLLSSRHESQGMVVLEAAACGVPTVGSSVGVVPDLEPDAAVGVDAGSPEALASAALRVLSQPQSLRQMGAAARARAVNDFGPEVSIERFMALYQSAIERHSS